MKFLENPFRNREKLVADIPFPSVSASRVSVLLGQCPSAGVTPLVDAKKLAALANIGSLRIKDERHRMGLGSFKALGAAYVIAQQACNIAKTPDRTTLRGRTFVTASAGNHGMSVAAGAHIFGAKAVVFIAETVPEGFAERLLEKGCDVRRIGKDYAASMTAARIAAETNGWTLLSDSSWPGYITIPHLLMEGYLQIASEAVSQCPKMPTHIFLQAGVGGLAASFAAYCRKIWSDEPKIIVVEPEAAPALIESIAAGHPVIAQGPESTMGRLDCKEPSLIALNGLARDADVFLTLSDAEVAEVLPYLAASGLETTPSGAAGVASALKKSTRSALAIDNNSHVLTVVSEAPE